MGTEMDSPLILPLVPTPEAPEINTLGVFADESDAHLKQIDDHGVVTDLAGSGGGSQPGIAVVRGPFAFAFNTPGLTAGVPFYVPTIGDFLLDAWFEIAQAWNGTTPFGDIGGFLLSGDFGFWNTTSQGPVPMGGADTTLAPVVPNLNSSALAGANVAGHTFGNRIVPSRFYTVDPLKVVVSEDGSRDGTDPGASQGTAHIYIVTAAAAIAF